MGAEFYPLPTGNALLDRVQAAIAAALAELRATPWTRAQQLDNVGLTTTDRAVFHGLGRAVRRWTVVRTTGYGIVAEGGPHANPADYINLRASIAGTFSILVE